MVKSGLPDATIVNTIATSDTQCDLSSAGLQALSQSGVSNKVVRAMLAAESKKKDAAPPVADNPATPDTFSRKFVRGKFAAGNAGHHPDDGATASGRAGANGSSLGPKKI
jgi:hypothetical protein